MGVELLHADRQTDMTKLTAAFRNFANAPKKQTEPRAAGWSYWFILSQQDAGLKKELNKSAKRMQANIPLHDMKV